MATLPTGTLTLLFTDIEGSTALLHRLGSRWGEALSAHRVIMREAIAAHEGIEMGTEGDSFFVVFTSAQRAVTAAIAAQRRLQRFDWPDGADVRVRMGIHTGEPQWHEDGYIGEDVHRAARIGSTAHGAQIVVSDVTQSLLPVIPDVTLRDLGHHRLKDLPDDQRLFDVVVTGLITGFPPLRSLGRAAALPAWTTPLVGRDRELSVLRELAAEPATRLITLTGPGGSGKTRMAVAVAATLEAAYPDGMYFVALSSAVDADSMWLMLAEALDAGGGTGTDRAADVLGRLRPRRALLVLDNVEQIADADAVVATLLTAAPQVDVLVTSRRPLLLVGVRDFPVSPLTLPLSPDFDAVARSSAVEMFAQHVRLVRPGFEVTPDNSAAVMKLCRDLDGLPLALELAAAQSRLFSPAALLARIDGTLGRSFGATDRPDRQRTLDDVIRWSYDLLSDAERAVFRLLAVFERGADLDAITAVAAGAGAEELVDAVAELVTASVVQVEDGLDGQPRITMLETIRSFARARLDDADEGADVRMRHLAWCVDTVERTMPMLGGSLHTVAMDRLSAIDDDIRAALAFALDPGESDPDRLASGHQLLITVTTRYWYRFGGVGEARQWQERALDSGDDGDSETNIGLLFGLGVSLLMQSALPPSIELLGRSLSMSRRLEQGRWQARVLNTLAVAHRQDGDFATSMTVLRESLEVARREGDEDVEAKALGNLAVLHHDLGEYEQAARAAAQSREINAARGDDWAVAIDEINYTAAVLRTEGAAAAAALIARWMPAVLVFGETELMIDVIELAGSIASELGEPGVAAQLLAAADSRRASAAMPRTTAEAGRVESWATDDRRSMSADDWDAAYASGDAIPTARLADVIGAIGATQARSS